MKRLLLSIVIALLTFAIGSALAVWQKTYSANIREEQATKWAASKLVFCIPVVPQKSLPIESLSGELQRIDEIYKKRCRIPTEFRGGWPTLKQLNEFSSCNDQWAKARREVINAVSTEYLVTY
jgi:hypothetical protein